MGELTEPGKIGIYYKVKKGETLWRIAKMYNVGISEITKANNIPNVAQLEVNQLILIPGAFSLKETSTVDLSKEDFIWPIDGKVIHFFHQRHRNRLNKGIDIEAAGDRTVKASRTGKVVFADYLPGYGYTIVLDHTDSFYSVYAHNANVLVGVGDMVSRNQAISLASKRRDMAFLHFQIRKNSIEDNPLYYLP